MDELLSHNLFSAAIFLLSVFGYRLFQQPRLIEPEMEKLISESLQCQFGSLKNQVNLHFLFNTPTVLKVLIGMVV